MSEERPLLYTLSPLERVNLIRLKQKSRQDKYYKIQKQGYEISKKDRLKRQQLIDQIAHQSILAFSQLEAPKKRLLITDGASEPRKKKVKPTYSGDFSYDDVIEQENNKINENELRQENSLITLQKDFNKGASKPTRTSLFAKRDFTPPEVATPQKVATPLKQTLFNLLLANKTEAAENTLPTRLSQSKNLFTSLSVEKPEVKKPSTNGLFAGVQSPGEKLETKEVLEVLKTSLFGQKSNGTSISFGKKEEPSSNKKTFSFGNPEAKASKPSFSFGKPENSQASQPSFSFGKPENTQSSKPPSSSEEKSIATHKPSFSFGSKQPELSKQPAESQQAKANGTSLFKLNHDDSQKSLAKPDEAPKTSFSFSKPDNKSQSMPLFSSAPAEQPQTSNEKKSGFAFGNEKASTGFSFGKSNGSGDAKISNGFSFGSNDTEPSKTSTTSKEPAPFSFSKASSAPADQNNGKPAFSFGKPLEKPAFSFGGSENGSLGKSETSGATDDMRRKQVSEKSEPPAFGSKAPLQNGNGISSNSLANQNAFSFGGDKNEPSMKKPAFSFGSNTTNSSSNKVTELPNKEPAFSFGGNLSENATKKTAFSFGASANEPATKKTAFSFGSKTNENSSSLAANGFGASKPSFSFGGSNSSASPSNGASADKPFSFGSATPPPAVGFGKSSTTESNGFNFKSNDGNMFSNSNQSGVFGAANNNDVTSTFGNKGGFNSQPVAPVPQQAQTGNGKFGFGDSGNSNGNFNFGGFNNNSNGGSGANGSNANSGNNSFSFSFSGNNNGATNLVNPAQIFGNGAATPTPTGNQGFQFGNNNNNSGNNNGNGNVGNISNGANDSSFFNGGTPSNPGTPLDRKYLRPKTRKPRR